MQIITYLKIHLLHYSYSVVILFVQKYRHSIGGELVTQDSTVQQIIQYLKCVRGIKRIFISLSDLKVEALHEKWLNVRLMTLMNTISF